MEEENIELLRRLALFLNNCPNYIEEKMTKELIKLGLSYEETVKFLLIEILGYSNNKRIEYLYFKHMIKELSVEDYKNNSYYKNIKLKNIKEKNWTVKIMHYEPFELFVYNDLKTIEKKVIPQIGFFKEKYNYPCILQNNREWMMITPNEIETMKKPIEESFGNVLTYGLGLGYFAYMTSLKENVQSVTIIEKDKEVITLFKKYILPQFKFPNKINIIEMDAFEYAKKKIRYDYVFVDIWHDPQDGYKLYKEFKKLEIPSIQYSYWIEDTIKYYLD